MNQQNLQHIILKPIVTEKSLMDQENGRYHFYIALTATKGQVAAAFTALYGHKVLSVNTTKVKGKVKTDWRKRRPIIKSDRKKAIVTVEKGKKIESLALKK